MQAEKIRTDVRTGIPEQIPKQVTANRTGILRRFPLLLLFASGILFGGCSGEMKLYVPSTLFEGSGANGNKGMVIFPWRTGETVLRLSSSDPRVAVDSFIDVRSGSRKVEFGIIIDDNDILDDASVVSIIAEADGFASAEAGITIVDDENPDSLVRNERP